MPSDELQGVALVTGGGRGIGASIARELADAGMRVAVTARTREQVEAIAGEVGGIALVGDVSRREDVEAWVERTEKELGPIDVLVNCAGIGGARKPFLDLSPEEWWQVLEVNMLGPTSARARSFREWPSEEAAGSSTSGAAARAYLSRTRRSRQTPRTPRARPPRVGTARSLPQCSALGVPSSSSAPGSCERS